MTDDFSVDISVIILKHREKLFEMQEQVSTGDFPAHIQRLVTWNTEVLRRLLKQIVAKRTAVGKVDWEQEPSIAEDTEKTICDEFCDVIDLPRFFYQEQHDLDEIELPPAVDSQLEAFVAAIANAHHSNPFHCLQRASAITMHLYKLLSRIVVKKLEDIEDCDEESSEESEDDVVTDSVAFHLHNHTYGITSDPLTQFALMIAALIHNVDHDGIPNAQLRQEDPELAKLFRNRSIIEQRSIDKAWKKLQEPTFYELRKCIYADETELKRFRSVIVNAVLSTDTEDPELQNLRMSQWEKTFSRATFSETLEDINRKATIVIEHLIQASVAFHYMQPWIVYEKWCHRDFEEQLLAFKRGRTSEDPSTTWVQNELDLFDNYIIPLAMQLKDCDAFVVGGDEYLNYALKNRQQFMTKGKAILDNILTKSTSSDDNMLMISLDLSPEAMPRQSISESQSEKDTKHIQRLIDWNQEMLARLLKQIVAHRQMTGQVGDGEVTSYIGFKGDPIGELADAINFPPFEASLSSIGLNVESVEIGAPVDKQLQLFLVDLSSRFKNKSFHGLDHGSQMCMTTKKMLSRMCSVPAGNLSTREARDLHNRTFGIASDPLAQFAIVFASLIHHVDHEGLSNVQLQREGHDLAEKYKNRSITEQNALDVAFSLLMQPKFTELRVCIAQSASEWDRFRQIVVNAVLATDFSDEELINFRTKRWEAAFVDGASDSSPENMNLRATLVIECLVQSSAVFHTSQNWHLYQKWNERLFEQNYQAYVEGRLGQDPSFFWYKSQMLFFDENVIPIAQRLSESGVLGNTSDEPLGSALANRQQWAAKGGDQVASMVARIHGRQIQKARSKRVHRRISLSAKTA